MKHKILTLAVVVALLLSLVPATPVRAASSDMQVPENGEALRQMVVDYAMEMASVEWRCTQDADFTKVVDWTPDLYYSAGQLYHGLPYTSDRISANANLDEFLAMRDGDGNYVGPVTWNEMPGSDCGGQVRLAYGWAGVLCDQELENVVFDPGEESVASGLVPTGNYDYSGYTRSTSTQKKVCEPNGRQVMYEAYAQLLTGDSLFVLYTGGGEHIMLVTGAPQVSTDASGNYMGNSTVPVLELNAQIHDKGSFKSNWNTSSYTFEDLFNIGFIPLTNTGFFRESIAAPTFRQQNIHIGGDAGFHDLMSGRVVSNYNIFTLTATVTNAQGKVVAQGISYPNSLRADLSALSYGKELLALAAGDYRFTLTAKIGYGTQTLVDTDIHYTGCPQGPVVYISDKGTGNGSSPDSPLGHASDNQNKVMTGYWDNAFHIAMEMLSESGGTIVVCDDVTLTSGRALTRYTGQNSPFGAPLISSPGAVVITSSYGGVDYRKTNGAELVIQRSGAQAVNLELNMASVWQDIHIRLDYNYAMLPSINTATIQAYIACSSHPTVFEQTVSVSLSKQGEALDIAKNAKYLPRIYGGSCNLMSGNTSDVTVLGGDWSTVVGGCSNGFLWGGSNVTIGGNAHIYEGVYGGCSDNRGYICGDVNLLIKGGTVAGKIVIGGSGKFLATGYNVVLTVMGTPDLSGVRIINATAGGNAASVVMDLGHFMNAGDKFTAYYNEQEYTKFVKAPDPPAAQQGDNNAPQTWIYIVIGAGVAVVALVTVIVIVSKKNKKQAKPAAEMTEGEVKDQ